METLSFAVGTSLNVTQVGISGPKSRAIIMNGLFYLTVGNEAYLKVVFRNY